MAPKSKNHQALFGAIWTMIVKESYFKRPKMYYLYTVICSSFWYCKLYSRCGVLLSWVSTECETSHLGGVLGRVSNSIAGGSFTLNGVSYSVAASTTGWDKVFLVC